MKNTSISLVAGANGTAPNAVLLESVFQDIQSGRYEDQIEQVRAAYREGGKKAATSLKKKLPAVLFSGRFLERTDTGIQEHSGILVADLDELSAERISELRGSLEKDPYVMFVFLSPTGSGLKVGFKVPANADRHAASFAAVDAHVKREYGENIDPACKNLSRLCFVSHDPNLYVNWEADELEVPDSTCSGQQMEGSSQSVFNETIEKFGNPFYRNRLGGISRINERFWAGLYLIENHLLYEPDEGRFYEYVEERGLWLGISEELLREHVAARLLVFSREPDGEGGEGFERKITRASEDTIIAHLKGQSEKKGIFDEKKRIIHCANGVLRLQPKGAANFTDFSVDDYSRNQSPIAYDPEGECPRFLNELIHGGVGKEDALLIQKWMGLALLGDNAPQKFIILDGRPGGGKSTLIRVIREIVGAQNVYQLRTQHLGDRFELFRYIGKTLLIGSDVNAKFLMDKNAYIIKSLVGGDPLSGEGKNNNGCFDIKGNYNLIISCNTRLKVLLEGDVGAWRRRLLIVRYDKPAPLKPIPDFDVQLIEEEGSGILNWALEGLGMAFADIDETGTLQLSREQERRIDALLSESESVRHFAKGRLIADPNGDVTSEEAVKSYAEFCSEHGWNPLPITVVLRQLPDLMLELFRASRSHGLQRDGKSQRGWKGVRLADVAPEHLDL